MKTVIVPGRNPARQDTSLEGLFAAFRGDEAVEQGADLHAGRGIVPGSIAVAFGGQSSVIDLSGAETIGEVALLIARAAPPAPRITAARPAASQSSPVLRARARPGRPWARWAQRSACSRP